MSFDGYGPEHNETIKSLRKATERALNCLKYVHVPSIYCFNVVLI